MKDQIKPTQSEFRNRVMAHIEHGMEGVGCDVASARNWPGYFVFTQAAVEACKHFFGPDVFAQHILLPCPFCGNKPEGILYGEVTAVNCSNRDCIAHCRQTSVEKWNTRHKGEQA